MGFSGGLRPRIRAWAEQSTLRKTVKARNISVLKSRSFGLVVGVVVRAVVVLWFMELHVSRIRVLGRASTVVLKKRKTLVRRYRYGKRIFAGQVLH